MLKKAYLIKIHTLMVLIFALFAVFAKISTRKIFNLFETAKINTREKN